MGEIKHAIVGAVGALGIYGANYLGMNYYERLRYKDIEHLQQSYNSLVDFGHQISEAARDAGDFKLDRFRQMVRVFGAAYQAEIERKKELARSATDAKYNPVKTILFAKRAFRN